MCGIIGILGRHEVAPVILEALRRLEYRGYDSAGIATLHEGLLERRRAVGKLHNLSDLLVTAPLRGRAGIGHTRWATHGAATVGNAHPHRAGRAAVVHNGIIENFRALRAELTALGKGFESDTDTETIVHLIDMHLSQGLDPRAAAAATLARLEGAFALCLLFEGEENLLIAARRGSPLAVGHGDGEAFVGSDAIALAPLTEQITYLEEGDWAVLTREGAEIFDATGAPVSRGQVRIERGAAQVDKSGYRHFMAKEIAEQPALLGAVLEAYRVGSSQGLALPAEISFAGCERLVLVACGTAHYACHVAKYWFEQIARLPVEIEIASEFRYRDPVLPERGMAIFVSQSGETADTLAALRYAKGKVARVISVVNVPTSSIARESEVALPIHAGVEVGVASTKAFTCQLAVLLILALRAAADRGHLSPEAMMARLAELRGVPALMAEALLLEDQLAILSSEIAAAQDVLFLGRGQMYPLALEGALKLKEISYIHAEGYAAGELKHGPIALIDGEVPVIVLAPRDALYDKTMSNMQEVMARNGLVLLFSDAEGCADAEGIWRSLALPTVAPWLAPLVYALPVQLLAYHAALARGTDVDQPRNLAKSVTVE
ncbi:MAG: glutamine--fructose-6-phosphate transaminase (isomerizing) [Alphaproteobacteria bacterium HGW-Alphaproteobacteria-2]|nr:MAG: glutamine--fructose-6-phosphate transaminase (isomerizing) [Alphaproteobacteria bacterium HGW-Alphaproteobacteria-2]